MKVRDLPPGRLLSVERDSTLAEVAKRMRMADSDSVAVLNDGKLVGIITESDLVRAIADGVDPQQVRAEVVMSADPATVSADEEAAVVAMKMTRLGVGHLPVVNKDGKPVGLLSARNLLAVLEKGAG